MINRRRLQRNLQSRTPLTDVLGVTEKILPVHKHSHVFTVRDNPNNTALRSWLCLVGGSFDFTTRYNGLGFVLQCLVASSMSDLWFSGDFVSLKAVRRFTWIGSSLRTWAYPLSYRERRLSSAVPSRECEKRRCQCNQRWPSWRWEPRRIAAKFGKRETNVSYTLNQH